jgi:hypothetical protein
MAKLLTQLAQLLAGEIPARPDWDGLMQIVSDELIVPQMLARLGGAAQLLPADVYAYLAETQRRSILRNERLFSTLEDVLRVLNAADVEPLLLKGVALWAAPPGPGDRLIRDLDLMVRPEEVERSVDGLRAAGFDILSDERANALHDVVVLGRPTDVGSIDLHQHAPGSKTHAAHADLYAHARRVSIAGGSAFVLRPEAQIYVMIIHDQVHDARFWRGGHDLRHLLDIAALSIGELDWHAVAAMCRSRTERIALSAELHAARAIAGANVPQHMLTLWPRLHYWRQVAQFEQPALTALVGRMRALRAALAGVSP